MDDHTGFIACPSAVRKNRWYASCRSSDVGAIHHTIRSASCRKPLMLYMPRVTTPFSPSCANRSSTSAAALAWSASRSTGRPRRHWNTAYIV
jgi:hypothetical protein